MLLFSAIEQSLVPDTEIEIDWESSSSDDSDLQTGTSVPLERPKQNAPEGKTSKCLSTIMKPEHLHALRVKRVKEDENTVTIDDAEKLPDKVDAVDKTEVIFKILLG